MTSANTEYLIVEAQPEHVAELIDNLRPVDHDEILAMGIPADQAEKTVWHTYRMSTVAWAGLADGRVVAVFGVTPLSYLLGHGSPWMLGTTLLDAHTVRFARESRPVVERMQRAYPRLTNYIDYRNKKTIRWLKWLGFDIKPAKPFGLKGHPFHKFTYGE